MYTLVAMAKLERLVADDQLMKNNRWNERLPALELDVCWKK
jgi:hypothetical protein